MSAQDNQERTPPHDAKAEAAILGAILLDNDAIHRVISETSVEHFYRESHRAIFASMLALANETSPIDTLTLREHLDGAGKLKIAGGDQYLVSLTSRTPAAVNVEHYAKIIRDKAVLRSVIAAALETLERGYDKQVDVESYVESTQQRFFEVTSNPLKATTVAIQDVIKKAFYHLEELADRTEEVTGVPTGFVDLDEKLGGMQPSDLVILAGRPAMGKTALALNIAANAATMTGGTVAVFSLEMSSQQLAIRMLCTDARVDGTLLKRGKAEETDWNKIIKSVGKVSKLSIYIDETPALSIMEISARARRLSRENDLTLLVVDYLQLMRGSELSSRRGREQEISEISRGLKALAKELGIVVLATAQLNRGVESRPNKRPLLSDLRESGAIEQDADVVMFLYRDEYYNEETTEKPGIAEVIIVKQRSGPTGVIELRFTGKWTRFDNSTTRDYGDAPKDYSDSPL